jgi:hypothetical protein
MEDQEKQYPQEGQEAANRARHASQCSICEHPECESIEHEWVNWHNTTVLSERYGVSRDAIYRHARYLNLFRQRRKNLRGALEKIIERLDLAPVTGSVVLGAIRELAKLDAAEPKLEHGQAAQPIHEQEAASLASEEVATEPSEAETQVTETPTLQ